MVQPVSACRPAHLCFAATAAKPGRPEICPPTLLDPPLQGIARADWVPSSGDVITCPLSVCRNAPAQAPVPVDGVSRDSPGEDRVRAGSEEDRIDIGLQVVPKAYTKRDLRGPVRSSQPAPSRSRPLCPHS